MTFGRVKSTREMQSLARGLLGAALLVVTLRQLFLAAGAAAADAWLPALLLALEGVAAGLAALGVLWNRAWAPLALVVLGALGAAVALIQALVLDIRPLLDALLVALVSVGIGVALALWMQRRAGQAASRSGSQTVNVAPR
jgi:hypothetical protein